MIARGWEGAWEEKQLQKDMKEIWGVMEFLYLDCGRGYLGTCICQNSLN